ncbi:MAG: hypothetical protein WCD70_02315 [Alphaproteobacteria bacterium]
MRFRIVLALVVGALALVASFDARAASPAFALTFKFAPPFSVGTPMPPVVYLDVCAAPDCSSVMRSVLMNCSVQRVAPNNTAAIVGCMVQAVSRLGFLPNSNAALLDKPVNLRIRANNLTSQVFPFPGGKPGIPEIFYNFVIMPGVGGFSVTNG